VLFTGASLACGFVNNIYLLVILRALRPSAAAPSSRPPPASSPHQFGRDRDRALGLFSSCLPDGRHHRPGARRGVS
jgi:hypothetical protein